MAQARAEAEARLDAKPWIRPAVQILRRTSNAVKNHNARRIAAQLPRMTQAERDAIPPYRDEDIEVVTALREHFRAELLAGVLETITLWDKGVSNIQQDDMPGFVRHYTPNLIKKIQEL